jgi:hypothetical protein
LQKIHKEIPTYSLPYGTPSRGGFNNRSSLRMAEVAFIAKDSALAKEIFNEVEKDIQQELRYDYVLSNPGGTASKQNVDRFITDFEEYLMKANRQATQADATRANQIGESLFKNKFTGLNVQDGVSALYNYRDAKRIRATYLDTAPEVQMPKMPGENPVPNINNPGPPKVIDTKKKGG